MTTTATSPATTTPGATAIDLEQPEDAGAIEALLDEAFGPDRHRKQSYRYRHMTAPVGELCLVAREGERLVGTVRHWPVTIVGDKRMTPALLLGPIGVAADRRNNHIGDRLMRESLRRALELGHGIVLLVGDLSYYGRFGFRPAASRGITMPGEQPHRLQLLELQPGSLDGVAGDLWPVKSVAARAKVRVRKAGKKSSEAETSPLMKGRYGT
jgi:predicted N-acetyltransferase YhbS